MKELFETIKNNARGLWQNNPKCLITVAAIDLALVILAIYGIYSLTH